MKSVNIFPLSTSVENGHTNFQQPSKQHQGNTGQYHFQETGEEVDMG